MLLRKTMFLFVAAVVLLTVCLCLSAWANGEEKEESTTSATTTTTTTTETTPTGAGPAEAAMTLTVAPISAIESRGHVDNMCESGHMLMRSIKDNGGMQAFGDYTVAYVLNPPKGSYQTLDGKTTWVPPAPGETQNIGVVIMDSLTNKPLPMSPLTLDVLDQSGNVVQSRQLDYYWGPMDDMYAANYSIPTAGTYSLRVRAPAPNIRRQDRTLGDRFTTPLNATFNNVKISPKAPASTETGMATPSGAGPTNPNTDTGTKIDEKSTETDTTPTTPDDEDTSPTTPSK